MDLILWRHAQAEDLPAADADLARRLTAKGRKQAERMAQWLSPRLPEHARVLASPAQRTLETAQALGRSFQTVAALAPGAGVDELLAAVQWPQGRDDTVVVVGHQPTLGMAAARVLAGHDLPWSLKKGAIWWLRSRERLGRQEVTLLAVQAPDLL